MVIVEVFGSCWVYRLACANSPDKCFWVFCVCDLAAAELSPVVNLKYPSAVLFDGFLLFL